MNYYIQGNEDKAEEIKAAFEKLGISSGYDFSSKDALYFTYEAKGETYMMSTLLDTGLDHIILTHPDYKELELPVEPKFKVGDSLQSGSHFTKILSINLEEGRYYCDNRIIPFKNQDLWHLAPKPHYDIKNFKPFDKVLVRDRNNVKWRCAWFSHYDKMLPYPFITTDADYNQCIPFEGNKHLLGTTDMCDEMYINW